MIILGIALLIAAVVAIFLQDILALWVCVFLGLFCLGQGMRQRPKRPAQAPEQSPVSKIIEPSAPISAAEPAAPVNSIAEPAAEPKPARKVSYHKTFSVAGVTFGCIHNEKYNNRQDVLSASRDEDKLVLEEYTYKGSPAFLIINERLGADIGNVPAWAVDKVIEIRKKYDTEIVFYSFRWFEVNDGNSDDSDDWDDDSDDYDYYTEPQEICSCRVRINGYKKR